MITFHDATVEGHKRVLKASWPHAGHYSDRAFGPQIVPPDGLDDWKIYDKFWKDDAACLVLSVNGD